MNFRPGYDLRKLPRSDRYDYGFLPPRFSPVRCSRPSRTGTEPVSAASPRVNNYDAGSGQTQGSLKTAFPLRNTLSV